MRVGGKGDELAGIEWSGTEVENYLRQAKPYSQGHPVI